MKNFKDSVKLLRFNLNRIIIFEVILQVVMAAFLIPFCFLYINLVIKASGFSYLSRDNVAHFFRMPRTWLGFLLFLILLGFFLMINAAGLAVCFDEANRMKKTSLIRMIVLGVKHALRSIVPHNMPMFLYILCYLPIAGAAIVALSLLNVRLPYYVSSILIPTARTAIVLVVIYLLLTLVCFNFVFAFPIFVTRKKRFWKSMIKSLKLVKKNYLRIMPGLFITVVLTLGIVAGLHYALTGTLLDTMLGLKSGFLLGIVFESVNAVLYLVFAIVGMPLILSYVCNCYYNLSPASPEEKNIDFYAEYDPVSSRHKEIKLIAIVLSIALLMDMGFYLLFRYNVISLPAEYYNKVTITAHRGCSKSAPENSLSAFELAIEEGADVIELDVRQTKDGEIVIMHDEYLMRTCNINRRVGDLTYEQLQNIYIDAGFAKQYPEEHIPTLKEAIELISGRADMNIELKPAATDQNLEESVAEIVKEYQLYDNCVVTSLTYDSIKKIKKYDHEIKTVYVMSVAMGDFYDLKYADAFSIKHRYLNFEVISRAHEAGKEVYAWTVNDERTLEKMMMLNVDSIITDKPAAMRKNMYKNIYGDTFFEYLGMYLDNQY